MSTSRGPRTEGDWRPRAGREALLARAELLAAVRRFFAARRVLEVETPALGRYAVTDVHLTGFATRYQGPGAGEGRRLHLATSPELAMKRLLAAGSGPIFQICRAFRDGEAGRHHNPEFTLLEWYRPGWDHHALMDEVAELLTATLGTGDSERHTYASLFEQRVGLDPHMASAAELDAVRAERTDVPPVHGRADLAQALFGALVEPHLGRERPTFVYDYPADQAALARLRHTAPPAVAVAERFELYYLGLELANGFHELADAAEQAARFEADRAERRRRGLPDVEADPSFLAALESGLPDCSGVALGLDRLLMLRLGGDDIRDVLAFPVDRA
ncbi:MAG: elongation factor P--(R)-beta-lysine ligase [Thermoanaerobaculia bacterium]|nr:elongation factor P--(R)-beta-lysine ligase [Thermoanaerobaculia bacterium]